MATPPSITTAESEAVPLAVWPCAQTTARWQRTGRYVPESTRHPGKMLPELARRIVTAYSQPGDIVVDPMCGIGTTLVEAAALGRRCIGVELEERWVAIARANLRLALIGATAHASPTVATGDARSLAELSSSVRGRADWSSLATVLRVTPASSTSRPGCAAGDCATQHAQLCELIRTTSAMPAGMRTDLRWRRSTRSALRCCVPAASSSRSPRTCAAAGRLLDLASITIELAQVPASGTCSTTSRSMPRCATVSWLRVPPSGSSIRPCARGVPASRCI